MEAATTNPDPATPEQRDRKGEHLSLARVHIGYALDASTRSRDLESLSGALKLVDEASDKEIRVQVEWDQPTTEAVLWCLQKRTREDSADEEARVAYRTLWTALAVELGGGQFMASDLERAW